MTGAAGAAAGDRLFSLVYASREAVAFDDDALQALLVEARTSNAGLDITGLLLHREGRFVQFLEGPEAAVRELMTRIFRDPRHTDIRVLMDGYPDERTFTEWSMGYEPIGGPARERPEGFRDTFEDLDDVHHPDAVLRATRELSLWFRVRSRARVATV